MDLLALTVKRRLNSGLRLLSERRDDLRPADTLLGTCLEADLPHVRGDRPPILPE